jgi:hypothetical protein
VRKRLGLRGRNAVIAAGPDSHEALLTLVALGYGVPVRLMVDILPDRPKPWTLPRSLA